MGSGPLTTQQKTQNITHTLSLWLLFGGFFLDHTCHDTGQRRDLGVYGVYICKSNITYVPGAMEGGKPIPNI